MPAPLGGVLSSTRRGQWSSQNFQLVRGFPRQRKVAIRIVLSSSRSRATVQSLEFSKAIRGVGVAPDSEGVPRGFRPCCLPVFALNRVAWVRHDAGVRWQRAAHADLLFLQASNTIGATVGAGDLD